MWANIPDCRKCNRLIPRGEFRLKGICEDCFSKRRGRWMLGVITAFALTIGSIVGLTERANNRDTEIVRIETESIDRDTQIVELLLSRMDELYEWAVSVEQRVSELQEAGSLQATEVAVIKARLEALKSALCENTGETAKGVVSLKEEVALLGQKLGSIEQEVANLKELPIETITKSILNPTIQVLVREKNNKVGTFGLGTAVLIKKEDIGKGQWRYWAITDFHLFNDILGYVKNVRPKQPADKQLDPVFIIAHFDGIKSSRPDYFCEVELLHPTEFKSKEMGSVQDFCLFSFVVGRSWDVAEVASDAEMKGLLPNTRAYNSSVFPSERPGLTTGIVSALTSSVYSGTIVIQCSANPGSSGSPVFAVFGGRPKVIGLGQVMSVSQVGGNSVLLYCSRMDRIREFWKLDAPAKLRGIF